MKISQDTGEHILSDIERLESNIAEDDLQRIVDLKGDLHAFLSMCKSAFPNINISKTHAYMEEVFDEHFTKEWERLYKIGGDASWPEQIPELAAISFITPKQRKDAAWGGQHA